MITVKELKVFMQVQSFEIVHFTPEFETLYWTVISDLGFDPVYREHYERCLERHYLKELDISLAISGGRAVGFCFLNWQPKYGYFKQCEIPEVQDLNVLSSFRQQGIGQALVEVCEGGARSKSCDEIGIGVGLDRSFGAAQRLYVRLGYVPDGQGVTYDRQQITPGDFRPIDENLSLMMTKSLKT